MTHSAPVQEAYTEGRLTLDASRAACIAENVNELCSTFTLGALCVAGLGVALYQPVSGGVARVAQRPLPCALIRRPLTCTGPRDPLTCTASSRGPETEVTRDASSASQAPPHQVSLQLNEGSPSG